MDIGINFFDVAPVYGIGHAEEVLGKALKGIRDKVYIATKCGLLWDEKGTIYNCLKPKSIRQEIDMSLSRLGFDYVDIYQLHWPDADVPIEDTLEEISKIKDSGKIRFFGISNFSIKDAKVCKEAGAVSQQCLYNMLDRNSSRYHAIDLVYKSEDEMIAWCAQNDIMFLPYTPLCQGLLSDMPIEKFKEKITDVRSENQRFAGKEFDKLISVREKLRDISKELGKPLSLIAISWILRHDSIGPVIFGSTNIDNIKINAKASGYRIPEEALGIINKELDGLDY